MMMHNWRGSLLIEFLAYLGIAAFIALLCATVLHQSHRSFLTVMREDNQQVEAYLVQDIFARDVHTAPAELAQWLAVNPELLVWHDGDHDIGWQYARNKLRRIVGEYNPAGGSWYRAAKSTMLAGVDSCAFQMHGIEGVEGVTMQVTCHGHEYTQCVAVRRGMVI